MKVKWSDQVASAAVVDDIDVEAANRRRLVKAKLAATAVSETGKSPNSGEDTHSEADTPSIVDFHLMAKRLGRNIAEKNPPSSSKKTKAPLDKRGRALEAYRSGLNFESLEPRGQKLDKVG